MMKTFLSILLFMLAGPAMAGQPQCMPYKQSGQWLGGPLVFGRSVNGAWVRWDCYHLTEKRYQDVVYVGKTADLWKVGTRVSAIMSATNPLLSLQTAGSRYTILPITAPSLAAVLKDMDYGE